jgi:heme o synthase
MQSLSADADLSLPLASQQPSIGDFFALMKPRVMTLVILTALTGILAAPGSIHPVMAIIAMVCISVGAGASGALNMWYDADIDEQMARTAARPIPSGSVTSEDALMFGGILSVLSVTMLGVLVNWFAGALLGFTIFFYLVIYTMWLKRWTPYNIVIGGAAGAFPPMIGWAAVTGGVSLESVLMFMIIFIWTPPHFWALALTRNGDYERVGVPMLPVVAGPAATRFQILMYSLLLAPLGVAPYFIGLGGSVYAAVATVLGAAFLYFAVNVYRITGGPEADKACKKLFGFSILYLYLLFAVLLAEHAVKGLMG